MPNRLARETSPYLLQHQHNPVDWFAWSQEAIELARANQKPIFLSVGYSACHWCHVMEHESFEDVQIAAIMNAEFVCIKVDREERPDIDHIYMQAVQIMTGRGGWPMSVFLTPDLEPFYGGTYWPPRSRMGMPGFEQVLLAVAEAWKSRRPQALAQATELTTAVRDSEQVANSGGRLRGGLITEAATTLERAFDRVWGGFGRAPKFPHSMDLQVLLRAHLRGAGQDCVDMVARTLDLMARGGIYDHLGGGFARYSVDERWLIPHFEKMLYDNALLGAAYVETYQVTGNVEFARIAAETFDYVLRDLTDPQGAFHSTEDADSEGVEGKFYAWTPAQIREILGAARGDRFCQIYDVSEAGNFEHGTSVLHLPSTLAECAASSRRDLAQLVAELAEDRARLFAARGQRVRPAKDDKILASWNGLMIDTLARASTVLDDGQRFLTAARRAARFILAEMRRADGRLLHSWRLGRARFDAYLDDYAALIQSLVTLYEADFDEHWIDEAVALSDLLLARFADPQLGGFFFTADDHERLITRPVDLFDSSVPSGNALAATALTRLGKLTGRADYLDAARRTLERGLGVMERATTAAGQLLIALDLHVGPTAELVVVGPAESSAARDIVAAMRRRFGPRQVVACRLGVSTAGAAASGLPYRSRHLDPLFAGKTPPDGETALFVCQDFTCQAPTLGTSASLEALQRLG